MATEMIDAGSVVMVPVGCKPDRYDDALDRQLCRALRMCLAEAGHPVEPGAELTTPTPLVARAIELVFVGHDIDFDWIPATEWEGPWRLK